MSRKVSIVPHTHWDREWYAPFEAYRLKLVTMMDGLLDLLEEDERFSHFHLDGQVAVVDDYLEVRPGSEKRVRDLISAGRLSVGPWYVLMDEFCVSGETLVRNLQLGLERASGLGADPTVGYLPDMFGHMAQIPQVLRSAGIGHAVVWRGVPAAVGRSGFWWESPDGSRVRAEYLPVGYAGGAFLPDDPAALVRRVAAHEAEMGSFLEPGWPMLMMNGGDHQNPQPWLADLLEQANRAQDRYFFRQSSLQEHLADAPTEGLPAWLGELRSGHRSPILPGVLSNRVDIKQAAASTEVLLEMRAEPLATLWLPAGLWPAAELDRAWTEVVLNSAHDSICGCSADEVGRAVLHRYDTARALGADAADRALELAAVALESAGPAVVNPLPRPRSGLVELLLAGTTAPAGTQQLEAVAPGRREVRGRGRDLSALLGQLTGDGWLGPSGRAESAALSQPDRGGLVLTLDRDAARPSDGRMPQTMAEAWARAGADPDQPLTVVVRRAGWQRVLVAADAPGWGWSVWAPPAGGAYPCGTVRVEDLVLDNGTVRVELDPSSGTFSLNGVAGQNLLVEEGDAGDTYNFCPVEGGPGPQPVTRPVSVEVEILERGPLRGVARVRRLYEWPEGLIEQDGRWVRSPTRQRVSVISDVEVRAGEAVARVSTSFENRCRDHRVRAVFPLGRPATFSVAECGFATVRRGLEAEGGTYEAAQATFPSRRLVSAGGLTVTHQGLLEYEVVAGEAAGGAHGEAAGGQALALTLLRATGVISRPTLRTRPNVAGPPVAVPAAQLPGPFTARYALAPGCADPLRMADEVWTPLLPFVSVGQGRLPDRGSRLKVTLGGCAVSSLRRRSGAIEMRVYNPSGAASAVTVPGHSGEVVDLRGRPLSRWEGRFEVGPWAIVTARFDATSLD